MRSHRGKRRILRIPCLPDCGDRAERDGRADLSQPDRVLPAASRGSPRPPGRAVPAVPRTGRMRGLCPSAGSRTPRVLFSRAADPDARLSLLRRPGAGLHAASAASPRIPRRAQHRRHPRTSSRRCRRAQARERRRCGHAPDSRPARPRARSPCPVAGLGLHRYSRSRSPDAPPPARSALLSRSAPKSRMPAPSGSAGWQARPRRDGKMSDVLPLCRDHVWQARTVAGPVLAPALAAVVLGEAEQRLAFAADAAAACRGSRRLLDRIGGAFGAAPGRRAALASLRRGRECPLCVACPRGRRARFVAGCGAGRKCRRAPRFRERVWFVRPPCGTGDGDAGRIRLRRHRRATRPMPGWRCCAGSWRSSCGAALGKPGRSGAASNRRLGSGPARALPAPSSAGRLTAPPRQRIFRGQLWGWSSP